MAPSGDGALVNVFDGNGKSVADAISRIDGTKSSFAENLTNVISPSECFTVHQRHLRGRRRDARRRCRCYCRHRYCHTTMMQSVKHSVQEQLRKSNPSPPPPRKNHDCDVITRTLALFTISINFQKTRRHVTQHIFVVLIQLNEMMRHSSHGSRFRKC